MIVENRTLCRSFPEKGAVFDFDLTSCGKFAIIISWGLIVTVGGLFAFYAFSRCLFWNSWEVIAMMDQFVTFGDLLKIGSILLELASLVFYIYYNHKHSNENHRDENKKQK